MRLTTALLLTLLCATASLAQEIKPLDVKLGLWETKLTTELGGMSRTQAMPGIPPEVLKNMPPEQRAKMEAMMKSRAAGGAAAVPTKTCITRESLNSNQGFARSQSSCKQKVITSTSTRQQIHVDCNQEEMKMAGDLTVERIDAEHVKGSMVMKGGQPEHPIETKMSFENTWLAADCGNVKPAIAK